MLWCVCGVMGHAQPGVGKNSIYGVGEGQESFQSIPERPPHLKGACMWKFPAVMSEQPTLDMSRNVLHGFDDRKRFPHPDSPSKAPSGHIVSELGQGQWFDLRRGPILWPVSNPFFFPYCFVLHILSCLAHLVMMFEGCIITPLHP